MEVSRKYSQTRATARKQRKHDFASSIHLETNMSKGLVNLTFAYPSILTANIYDGCLGIVAAMACDTHASCVGTMFIVGIFCWHNAL